MIKPLTIEAGAFEFALPTSFLPKYKQHEVVQNYRVPDVWYLQNDSNKDIGDLVSEYTFNYNFEIKSSDKVTFVGAPSDTVTSQTSTGYIVKNEKSSKIPKREIKIFYKTSNMFAP